MAIHERIIERRKHLGFTADYVAEQLGVSRATIYRYESANIENMGIDKMGPLAKVLQTTPAYLMGMPRSHGFRGFPALVQHLVSQMKKRDEPILACHGK